VGTLLDRVRNGTVSHPLQRGFDRELWSQFKTEDELDKALVTSVLAIDDLIRALRPHAMTRTKDVHLLRALVAAGNTRLKMVEDDLLRPERDGHGDVYADTVILRRHPETSGTINELTDGLGDSFVFPLREALDASWNGDPKAPSGADWRRAAEVANAQGVLANKWFLCWYFLMEVVWLDARLVKQTEHSWRLSNHPSEAARQIAAVRRHIQIESLSMGFGGIPAKPPASTTKTIVCEWVGDRLYFRVRSAGASQESWAEKIFGYASIPGLLLSGDIEAVPLTIAGTTVTVGEAARLYASFIALYSLMSPLLPKRTFVRDSHPRDGFRISTENLSNALSEITAIEPHKVDVLLEEATFRGGGSEVLWGKPLVFAGGRSRFVFLPAMKSSVLRAVNYLIDSYASDHGKKGIFFQEHCRRHIGKAASSGPWRDKVWTSPRAVESDAGDIDICMVVGDLLIVIETKYVPLPSDAYDYWRVNRTVDAAIEQVRKKVELIQGSVGGFVENLKRRYGLGLPFDTLRDIVPLVVVSDTFRAGYGMNDVYVADMEILETYFSNKLVQRQEVNASGLRMSGVHLFVDFAAATGGLRGYLSNPPMIAGFKAAIEPRETNYPTGVRLGGEEIYVRQVGPGLPEIPNG
jgi:hypothetical protein